jgi:DNA-binding XRE family transcriptional regulator
MASRKTSRSGGASGRVLNIGPAESEWNYSSGIRIFHFGDGHPPPLTATGFLPMPPDRQLAGCVCQAARALLDVTQAWLWKHAQVSRKTINDFENGYARPKAALNLRMRRALERAGAQFIYGENIVGVIVHRSRSISNEPAVSAASDEQH